MEEMPAPPVAGEPPGPDDEDMGLAAEPEDLDIGGPPDESSLLSDSREPDELSREETIDDLFAVDDDAPGEEPGPEEPVEEPGPNRPLLRVKPKVYPSLTTITPEQRESVIPETPDEPEEPEVPEEPEEDVPRPAGETAEAEPDISMSDAEREAILDELARDEEMMDLMAGSPPGPEGYPGADGPERPQEAIEGMPDDLFDVDEAEPAMPPEPEMPGAPEEFTVPEEPEVREAPMEPPAAPEPCEPLPPEEPGLPSGPELSRPMEEPVMPPEPGEFLPMEEPGVPAEPEELLPAVEPHVPAEPEEHAPVQAPVEVSEPEEPLTFEEPPMHEEPEEPVLPAEPAVPHEPAPFEETPVPPEPEGVPVDMGVLEEPEPATEAEPVPVPEPEYPRAELLPDGMVRMQLIRGPPPPDLEVLAARPPTPEPAGEEMPLPNEGGMPPPPGFPETTRPPLADEPMAPTGPLPDLPREATSPMETLGLGPGEQVEQEPPAAIPMGGRDGVPEEEGIAGEEPPSVPVPEMEPPVPQEGEEEEDVMGGVGMDLGRAVMDALGEEEGGAMLMDGPPDEGFSPEIPGMPHAEGPPEAREPPDESLIELGMFLHSKGYDIEYADEADFPFDGEAVHQSPFHIIVFRHYRNATMRDAIDFHNTLMASRAIFGFMVTDEPNPDLRVFAVGKDMAVLHRNEITPDGEYIRAAMD